MSILDIGCGPGSIKLIYLLPYSPDLNPIEEFFAELKGFIKRYWHIYEGNPKHTVERKERRSESRK
jgi:transposase